MPSIVFVHTRGVSPEHSEAILENVKNYTINEARSMLSIGRTKMYDLMNSGELRFIVIGSVRRIPHMEIARFMDAQLLAA
ncbi:helix-turn-helix domain-containing protein [Novosphingobium resinovorum]|nr:helix-turn-helix domain-containing protein [Novosphingobium resinovorum]